MVDGVAVGLAVAELLGAVAAFATAAHVGRLLRFADTPSLRRFTWGFGLLGASQVCAFALQVLVLTSGTTLPRETFDLYDVAFWLHYAFLLAGLGAVFASFGRHPFRWAPAVAVVLLRAGPVLELLTILLLFFVVLHAGLNHIARKGPGSIYVAIGFFFLFAAHSLNLIGYTPLEPRWLPAEVLNLVGLLLLFWSVKRPRSRVDG